MPAANELEETLGHARPVVNRGADQMLRLRGDPKCVQYATRTRSGLRTVAQEADRLGRRFRQNKLQSRKAQSTEQAFSLQWRVICSRIWSILWRVYFFRSCFLFLFRVLFFFSSPLSLFRVYCLACRHQPRGMTKCGVCERWRLTESAALVKRRYKGYVDVARSL